MHVRVCVECGEEYRPEIVACADCGGRLEDRHDDGERTVLPTDAPGDTVSHPEAEFTETVLRAEKVTDLTPEADQLVEEGIPFRLRPAPEGGYRLLVPPPDRDRALALLGLLADGTPRAAECPACGTAVPAAADECPECGLAVGDEPEAD
jgi:hypothetical protein